MIWGSMRKVNCCKMDITPVVCPGIVGSYPPQAEGLETKLNGKATLVTPIPSCTPPTNRLLSIPWGFPLCSFFYGLKSHRGLHSICSLFLQYLLCVWCSFPSLCVSLALRFVLKLSHSNLRFHPLRLKGNGKYSYTLFMLPWPLSPSHASPASTRKI